MKSRITDIQRTANPPVIGHIKIGEKVKNQYGVEYPRSLDHFIAQSDHYLDDFKQKFPDNTSKITIVFVSDDQNYSCCEYYEWRNAKGKTVATGDGKEIKVNLVDKETGEYIGTKIYDISEPKVLESLSQYKKMHVFKMRFMIAEINHIYGTWQLRTSTLGAASSINDMVSAIDSIYNIAGTIVGIPFDLIVKMVKSDKAGQVVKYPKLSLIPNLSYDNLRLISSLRHNAPHLIGSIMTNEYMKEVRSKMDLPINPTYAIGAPEDDGSNEDDFYVPEDLLKLADSEFSSFDRFDIVGIDDDESLE